MPDYRLYSQDRNGEVVTLAEEFFATSDEAAIHHAGRLASPHIGEVWSGDRFVAVVMGADPPREDRRLRGRRWFRPFARDQRSPRGWGGGCPAGKG